MKKISALVFALLCATILSAQNYHSFKAGSAEGYYTDLGTQGLEIQVSNLDDGIAAPQEIGEEGLKMDGSLTETALFAGPATGDTTICAFGTANIALQEFTGFITWQTSTDSLSGWQAVQNQAGSTPTSYTTPPLTASAYYRAAVFQPGSGVAFSNIVFVEVVPTTPVIEASGDALNSNTILGNQWYNEDGPIPGATGQFFLAVEPGTYYVIVTSGTCASAPSNPIEILTVGTKDISAESRFKIYPNPVGDELTIEMEENTEEVRFEILNALGQVVHSGLFQGRHTIEMRALNTGIYIIRFKVADIHLFKKLIKN